MRRTFPIFAVAALAVATCDRGPAPTPGKTTTTSRALVALDVGRVAEHLERADALPATLSVRAEGEERVVELPEPEGTLEGNPALGVPSGERLELDVRLRRADEETTRGSRSLEPLSGNEALKLDVLPGDEGLLLRRELRTELPEDTRLGVDRGDGPRTGDAASTGGARAIAEALRERQVRSVTPWTTAASRVDALGPLVGLREPDEAEASELAADLSPALEAEPEPEQPMPSRSDDGGGDPAPRAAAPNGVLAYYSVCGSGRPVPHHRYMLRTRDGERIEGRTDRFGLVVLDEVRPASIDFGPNSRKRRRSYDFEPGESSSHRQLLEAIRDGSFRQKLTATLDLKDHPLPEAREGLVELLDHDRRALRLNAALALSRYADLAPVARQHLAALDAAVERDDEAAVRRHLTILGALRHGTSRAALEARLLDGDGRERALAAWGLGMIGSPASVGALAEATSDDRAEVRRAVALALGRIGTPAATDALGRLAADDSEAVRRRTYEARALAETTRELREL